MKLSLLAEKLDWRNLTPNLINENEVEIVSGYASDMLSDVLAHAPSGSILVTIQTNINVLAVAVHAGLSAVVFSSGRMPDESVMTKAVEEKIVLYTSDASTFDVAGKMYAHGVRGI